MVDFLKFALLVKFGSGTTGRPTFLSSDLTPSASMKRINFGLLKMVLFFITSDEVLTWLQKSLFKMKGRGEVKSKFSNLEK